MNNQKEAMGNTELNANSNGVAGLTPAPSVFERELVKHKKSIAALGNLTKYIINNEDQELKKLLTCVYFQSRSLSLVNANFKCRKCGTEENLTTHHLISRNLQDFMPFDFYLTQRNYWANLLVLCIDCHIKLHQKINRFKLKKEEMKPIPKEFIDKLKIKYCPQCIAKSELAETSQESGINASEGETSRANISPLGFAETRKESSVPLEDTI